MCNPVSNMGFRYNTNYNKLGVQKSSANAKYTAPTVSFKGSVTSEVVKKGTKECVKKMPAVLLAIASLLGIKGLLEKKETEPASSLPKVVEPKLSDDGISLSSINKPFYYNHDSGGFVFEIDGSLETIYLDDFVDQDLFKSDKSEIEEHFNRTWQDFKWSGLDLDTYIKTNNLGSTEEAFLDAVKSVKGPDVNYLVKPNVEITQETNDDNSISYKEVKIKLQDESYCKVSNGDDGTLGIKYYNKDGAVYDLPLLSFNNLRLLLRFIKGESPLMIEEIIQQYQESLDRSPTIYGLGDKPKTLENWISGIKGCAVGYKSMV